MSNLDSILKSRGITLPKAVLFPVVMYRYESRTIKKAECQRTDAFALWCWRRLLRVPWTARRSNQYPKWNQSWIFIGRIDVEAETPLLWPPDIENWLIGKDLDSGKDLRARRRGWQRIRWLDLTDSPTWWTRVWACSGSGDGQGSLVCCSPWGHSDLDTTEWLNWTERSCSKHSWMKWYVNRKSHTLMLWHSKSPLTQRCGQGQDAFCTASRGLWFSLSPP